MISEHDSYLLRCQASQALERIEREHVRPSVIFKPRLFIDGNEWCALYGVNLAEGVAGFGDSPENAMHAFDCAWRDTIEARVTEGETAPHGYVLRHAKSGRYVAKRQDGNGRYTFDNKNAARFETRKAAGCAAQRGETVEIGTDPAQGFHTGLYLLKLNNAEFIAKPGGQSRYTFDAASAARFETREAAEAYALDVRGEYVARYHPQPGKAASALP